MDKRKIFLIIGIVLVISGAFVMIYVINTAGGNHVTKAESRPIIGAIIKPFVACILVCTLGFTLISKSIK